MPPPFRPSTTAPVGPNRGIVVSHGTAVNRDASGGTPATQAVARIKRGQGHIGRCVGRVLGGRDRPQVKGSDRRPGPCVDDLGRNGDAADRVVGDAQQASQHRPIHYIGQPKRQIGVGDIGIQVTTGDGIVCAPRPTGRWALKPVAGYGRLCPDRPTADWQTQPAGN
ncbi:MAG: hypothetical protein OXC57_07505 [Rhodobacteraceae bacterium]|nr:hypothetical protein [Paracoccaceae bacterium]